MNDTFIHVWLACFCTHILKKVRDSEMNKPKNRMQINYSYERSPETIQIHWKKRDLVLDDYTLIPEQIHLCDACMFSDKPLGDIDSSDVVARISQADKNVLISLDFDVGEHSVVSCLNNQELDIEFLIHIWYGSQERLFYCGSKGFMKQSDWHTSGGGRDYERLWMSNDDISCTFELAYELLSKTKAFKYEFSSEYSSELISYMRRYVIVK